MILEDNYMVYDLSPNPTVQQTRQERPGLVRRSLGAGGCHRCVPCAGPLSLDR